VHYKNSGKEQMQVLRLLLKIKYPASLKGEIK